MLRRHRRRWCCESSFRITNMYTEELLLGDDEDTEEDMPGEIDDIFNDLSLIYF
jgi:hypothetical protein